MSVCRCGIVCVWVSEIEGDECVGVGLCVCVSEIEGDECV